MHPSVFFPENLSTNPSISPSHYVYPSFNRHHCSTKRASISQSVNGFFHFQKMVFQSPILSKNYTISIGFYAMASDKLAKECFAKRASVSNSVIFFSSPYKTRCECPSLLENLGRNSISNSAIGFCIPRGMVSESPSVLKNHSYAYGFCDRRCYFRRPSHRNSGYGFCDHEQAFESVKECCAQRASKSSFQDGFFRLHKRASESPSCCRSHGNLSAVRSEGVGIRDDEFYIRRCVEIARKAIGYTSPNPLVGCVIVKNGEIVGEGFHPKPGQPHAEVFALRNAGELAENATAYVSLEPCNHYGRTPPCTEALIRAKVKHVVVGMVDPNPIVASKGVERLRESGIEVTVGVEEELCRKLNEAYIHRMLTGKPFVTLRYSLSFDGRILNQLGKGVAESGGYYSQLLQEYDGVIISSNALAENFSFPASQEAGANQPLQIIIATSSNSPLHFPTIATEAIIPVIIFRDNSTIMDPTTESNLSQQGIETVVLEQMDLRTILDYCGCRGLCSVLLDLRGDLAGFSEILETGFEEGLIQKVVMEMCPVLGGNEENSSMLALKSFDRKSMGLKDLQSRISRGSVVVEGYIR